MTGPGERFDRRAARVEEASACLLRAAVHKPVENDSEYAKRRWHAELMAAARAYARAMSNLARSR